MFFVLEKNVFGQSSLGLVGCLRCPDPEVFAEADLETEIRVAEAEKNEEGFRILTNVSGPRLLRGNNLTEKTS